MNHKLNTITNVITMSIAALIPNNMQANEEAKALLEELKSATHPEEMRDKLYDFFLHSSTAECCERMAGDNKNLCFEEWLNDTDESNLLTYMISIQDLGLRLFIWDGDRIPNEFWESNLCGLTELHVPLYTIGHKVPDCFWENLKNNETLQILEIFVQNDLEIKSLTDAITSEKNKIKEITLRNAFETFLDTTPIAEKWNRHSLEKLTLQGFFYTTPLKRKTLSFVLDLSKCDSYEDL